MNPSDPPWNPERQRAESLLEEAEVGQESGDWLGAEEKLREALVVDPGNGDVNGVLGQLLFEQGRFEEAQEHWELAVKVKPVAWIYSFLGSNSTALGRSDEAMEYFRKALALDADYEEAHLNLGGHLMECEPELARFHFTRALEIDPVYSHAARGLGVCFQNEGDHKRALEHAERAVEMEPTDAGNWVFVAECRYTVMVRFAEPEGTEERAEQLHQAQHALERAIELAPTDAMSHLLLALLHGNWGAEELVEGLLRRAVRLGGDGLFVAFLADHLADQARFVEAQELFEQAAKDYPDCPLVFRDHGRCLLRYEHPDLEANLKQATELFEHALALDPSDPESLYRLADALFSSHDDLSRAKQLAEESLRLRPDHVKTKTLLNEIQNHTDQHPPQN